MVSCITMCGIIWIRIVHYIYTTVHTQSSLVHAGIIPAHKHTPMQTHTHTPTHIHAYTRIHEHMHTHTHAHTEHQITHTHYICFVSMLKLCLPSRHFVVCLDQLSRLGTFHSCRYHMLAVIHLNMTKGDSSNGGNPI